MKSFEIMHQILIAIGSSEKGMSSCEIAQKISERTKIYFTEQRLRHHLSNAIEDGLVDKNGRNYILTNAFKKNIFIKNGLAVIYDKKHSHFGFYGCPHYNFDCVCPGYIDKNCMLIKELKDIPIVRRYLKIEEKEAYQPSSSMRAVTPQPDR